uniref:Uncharacterized protein n=1 Tax=Romanomermis culicivorax TaxID=13658 RepID=A0A915HMM9_ROMCU
MACPNRTPTLPAAAVVSALTPLLASLPPPRKYATLVNVNSSMRSKTTDYISVIKSYRPTEGTPAPLAHFITQGPPPGIPTDSALEVVGQLESMNLLVDAVGSAVEQGSRNARPTAVVAASPSMMTTGAQTLAAIAQQQPVAASKPPPKVPNAFGGTLRAVNDDISLIKGRHSRWQLPMISKDWCSSQSPPMWGLVIHLPGEEPISSDDDDKE